MHLSTLWLNLAAYTCCACEYTLAEPGRLHLLCMCVHSGCTRPKACTWCRQHSRRRSRTPWPAGSSCSHVQTESLCRPLSAMLAPFMEEMTLLCSGMIPESEASLSTPGELCQNQKHSFEHQASFARTQQAASIVLLLQCQCISWGLVCHC